MIASRPLRLVQFTPSVRRSRLGPGLLAAPPASSGEGPARSAHETLGRTLQRLRGERQSPQSGPSGASHAEGLAQMAAPSQPTNASLVGAVQSIAGTPPVSPSAGRCADMGGIAARHISGGAGCLNRARTVPWEPRVGNCPRPPGQSVCGVRLRPIPASLRRTGSVSRPDERELSVGRREALAVSGPGITFRRTSQSHCWSRRSWGESPRR